MFLIRKNLLLSIVNDGKYNFIYHKFSFIIYIDFININQSSNLF